MRQEETELNIISMGGMSGDIFIAGAWPFLSEDLRKKITQCGEFLNLGHLKVLKEQRKNISGTLLAFPELLENKLGTHPQKEKHYEELLDLLNQLKSNLILNEEEFTTVLELYQPLFNAEQKAHGIDHLFDLHLHEVAFADSIFDFCAAAMILNAFTINVLGSLKLGRGFVHSSHGKLKVPVPAVKNLIEDFGLNTEVIDQFGEATTPTGAAIWGFCFKNMQNMAKIKKNQIKKVNSEEQILREDLKTQPHLSKSGITIKESDVEHWIKFMNKYQPHEVNFGFGKRINNHIPNGIIFLKNFSRL